MKTDFLMAGVKRVTLDNGLRILFARGPKPKKNFVLVGFKAGSAYDSDEKAGLFHFLEHALFKSTKTKRSKKILEELEDDGTSVNAFTSHHYTVLQAKMLPHLTAKTLRLFFEMVANPEYNKKEFDLERKVVLDEMENDGDNHLTQSDGFFFSSLFPGQYLCRSVLGYFSALKAIAKADLEEAKRRYYVPNNSAIVVLGKLNKEAILRVVQDTFGQLEPGSLPNPLPKIEIANSQTIRMVPRNALRSQAYLCLGYKTPGSNHRDYPKLMLLDSVLSGGMSSRLFVALRQQRGIGYHMGTHFADFGDIGVFYAFIDGFYKKGLQNAVRAILGEFQNLAKKTISSSELERAKSRFISDYEEGLEEPEVWASQILEKEFFAVPYDFRRFKRYIEKITPEDIRATAQKYLTDDYTLTALLPKGFTPFI